MSWDLATARLVIPQGAVDYEAGGHMNTGDLAKYLQCDRSAGTFNFAGAFTVEVFGVNFTALTQPQAIISAGGASPQWSWYIVYEDVTGNKLTFSYSFNGTVINHLRQAWTPSLSTNYDIAITRDSSNVIRMYIDGVYQTKVTAAGTLFNAAQDLVIGRLTTGSFGDGRSKVKAVRITDGVARYVTETSYTVPTLPLPTQ